MIAIDIRFLSENMRDGIISSGVGVFFSDVIDGIRKNNQVDKILMIVDSKQYETAKKIFSDFKFVVLDYIFDEKYFYLYFLHNLIDGLRLSNILKKHNISEIWFPMATPYYYLYTGLFSVSTIHDLILLHESPNSLTYKIGFKNIIKKSKIIVTDSEYVKKDIIYTYKLKEIDSNKIYSIPCPIVVNEEYSEIDELKNIDYIIDVNAYQNRKNGITLIKAFNIIKDKIPYDLVFCGGYNPNGVLEKMQEVSKELGIIDRVHFYLSIPIEQRNWLIAKARLFVSPSLSEGFGRTPVEAGILKVPVLSTKVDSLVEVTLGLFSYYNNPEDYNELADCILKELSHEKDASELLSISNKLKYSYLPEVISKKYLDLIIGIDNKTK